MILIFILIASCTAWRPSWMPPIYDESCTFTRDDTYQCLNTYVDINPKDGQITADELNAALDKSLPVWMKPFFWATSSEKIMGTCDYDKNGVITARDWMLSKKTCLALKSNWCTADWFCKRAKADSDLIKN